MRPATFRLGFWARLFITSSVRPSAKNPASCDWLKLANGITAMDFCDTAAGLAGPPAPNRRPTPAIWATDTPTTSTVAATITQSMTPSRLPAVAGASRVAGLMPSGPTS